MKAKKVILILVVGFLVYWMFSDPAGMAGTGGELAASLWGLLLQFFDAVLAFLRELG